ncbi:MAG: cytochrome c biogenesis protein CcsA [Rikenellaceae bacterium]|jgi:ABC-type transport system involved in cytochrome c biogenesis permease subunit|nr:cytochrome c biogenesis protein CcsA [Rikenellaceae bacterium]
MRRFSVWLWGGLIIVLVAATFVEKYLGAQRAHSLVYGSWWFAVLWGAMAAAILLGIRGKGAPLRLVHISLVVILAGALCTKLLGERGQIVLREGEAGIAEGVELPFELVLDEFSIEYYAGTNTPSDYVSRLTVREARSGAAHSGQASMNRIFSHGGYRFYQSSFVGDDCSVLTIYRDPVGIAVTYAGYVLFALSGLWMMARRFRVRKKLIAALLLLLPSTMFGAQKVATLDAAQARQFSDLWMLHDGRITSVSAFAHDFTMKLAGKSAPGGMSAEQVLAGFLFFPEQWQHAALFEVRSPALKRLLNAETEKASFADFFDDEGGFRLAAQPPSKEVVRLSDRIQLVNMLHSGEPLRLFPLPAEGGLHWYHPTENFPPDRPQEDITFVRTVLTECYAALHSDDRAGFEAALRRIGDFQRQHAGRFLPSERHRRVEIFYLRHNLVPPLFMFNLAVGILALLSLFVRRDWRPVRLFSTLHVLSFCLLSISIGLRTYVGGRLPFASGFETMLLMAWIAMAAGWIFRRRASLVLPFGLLASGCALLVAHLGMANPKITPLVPVLSSPLLSLHVSLIMTAYLLLAFTALNSLVALVSHGLQGSWGVRGLQGLRSLQSLQGLRERARAVNLTCLPPALFLLGAGIFIGAVWANVSWGSYWSWDPKETWALITFMLYALALHKCDLSPVAFHLFVLLSFLSVPITYFGVNYFFGGMHGYG